MVDIVSKEVRSRMMSGIKGKNTKPELLIRKALHQQGFRYKLHDKSLPGKPDLVFPRYRAVIMVNGCFWHGHRCHLFKWPKTRPEFWRKKIERNIQKDSENLDGLQVLEWRVLTIWECTMKGRERIPMDEIVSQTADWLASDKTSMEITGNDSQSQET
ncbi:MAG TPA: DNA mismatch endonuclease Vsr [Gammaproteobacteria bacterium]|nr:DNA mismatch endonuclease Vsr [Gammaproteobacteria bacterium]